MSTNTLARSTEAALHFVIEEAIDNGIIHEEGETVIKVIETALIEFHTSEPCCLDCLALEVSYRVEDKLSTSELGAALGWLADIGEDDDDAWRTAAALVTGVFDEIIARRPR